MSENRSKRAPARSGAIAAETRAKLHWATGGLSTRLASGIRILRDRQRLTVLAAAEATDLEVRHYQKIEGGEVNATLITLSHLADGFDVDALELFVEEPRARRPLARRPIERPLKPR